MNYNSVIEKITKYVLGYNQLLSKMIPNNFFENKCQTKNEIPPDKIDNDQDNIFKADLMTSCTDAIGFSSKILLIAR